MAGSRLKIEPLGGEYAGDQRTPRRTTRLLVPIEFDYEQDWLASFGFDGVEFSVLTVSVDGASGQAPAYRERRIHRESPILGRGTELPSFSEVLRAMQDEQPDACLVLADGILGKLVMLGADLLGVACFVLVLTREQLDNIPRRQKPRPDLFFLADSELFPQALLDVRYGTTLLPAGHPERDVAVRGQGPADHAYNDPRYGDGQAAVRILAAMRRWRDGQIEPVRPELSIIVPAYRESGNLAVVCQRLLAMLDSEPLAAEILLVDDGSPDDTYAQAIRQMWCSPRIRGFTKGTPRGMGTAIIHGLLLARAPYIAITMGDGSDDVGRIPEMLRRVRDDGFSLAIGCRYRHPENYENIPRQYRFWSWCFRLTTRVLIGLQLKDYTNAFRLFNRDIFARYGPESGGFEISPEITFKSWFATRRVAEVDVRHLKRASGQSTFSFLRAGPGYGRMLIKALVNRVTGHWFTFDW